MTPRFCLRCGRALGRAREGRHVRRRCAGCGWTFYDNPVPAAVAIAVRRGAVLFTRRARKPHAGTWDLPGGFLEAGETPDAALGRELREELGVGVAAARLVGFATDRYGPGGFPVLTILYRVTLEERAITPADDVAEARWFARDRLPLARVAFPGLRHALRRYLGHRTRARRPSRAGPVRSRRATGR